MANLYLVEEFRAPVVDRFTLNLINNRVFCEADFHPNLRGENVYFNREAMKRYFAEYESCLNHEFDGVVQFFRMPAGALPACFVLTAGRVGLKPDSAIVPGSYPVPHPQGFWRVIRHPVCLARLKHRG